MPRPADFTDIMKARVDALTGDLVHKSRADPAYLNKLAQARFPGLELGQIKDVDARQLEMGYASYWLLGKLTGMGLGEETMDRITLAMGLKIQASPPGVDPWDIAQEILAVFERSRQIYRDGCRASQRVVEEFFASIQPPQQPENCHHEQRAD